MLKDKEEEIVPGGFVMSKRMLSSLKSLRLRKKEPSIEMPLAAIEIYKGMPRCVICHKPFTLKKGVTRNNFICGRYQCLAEHNKLVREKKNIPLLFKKINEGTKRKKKTVSSRSRKKTIRY